MLSAKQKSSCSNDIVNLGLDVEPDDETIIYAESCDESVNLSSDKFSSVKDATESDLDDLANACIWNEVDPKQPQWLDRDFPLLACQDYKFQLLCTVHLSMMTDIHKNVNALIYYVFITMQAYEDNARSYFVTPTP